MATALFKEWWLILFVWLLLAAPAAAQTAVSGAVAVDTHWSTAGSPYLVSGDVVVQNGAVLTIDPDVTVYMAAGANLTVQAGGIKALGTAIEPIRVLSDKTRLGQTAAPGDWKQWVFNPGTLNTRLDHVVFEHGSGLAIKGSAPVLNYLALRNHQGAAMTTDLAASPSGVGNQASGNAINGISVPAGDIAGNVRWGLHGIPYVVESGTVSVGVSPAVTSVTPNTLQQGETVTVNVTGSRLAGLTDAYVDAAGTTAQILPGATDTQASLSVTADASAALGAAAMRLLTDAGEVKVANAFTLKQAQPTLTGLNPAKVYAGQGTVDVTLTGHNFTDQSVVLTNGTPVTTEFLSATQLRASVTVPAAAGNLPVSLRTPDLNNVGQYLTSNELILTVAAAQLTITPSSASAAKGSVKTFTVGLPYQAPPGGITVNLVSSVPTVATVPATVTVAEGQSSTTFQLSAVDLGNTVVTASKVGFVSGQAQMTVVPPPSLSLTPASVTLGVGRNAELTVTSSVAAGESGLTVVLSSNAPSVANVPVSVTIPAGASTAKTTVSTSAIGNAIITAQATDFVSGSANVAVHPVSLILPTGALVSPGLTRSIPITLSDPAPADGLSITLASSNTAVATVPASISVASGQTSVNFTLSGAATGAASISATASGYQSATMPVSVDATTIGIGNPAAKSISVAAEDSQTFAVTISHPAPAGGVVIDLTTANASIATVSPSSVTIAEGQTSGGVVVATVTGVATGSTTLLASSPGLNTASVPVTVTGKAEFAFVITGNKSAVTVGKNLKTRLYEVYVSRRTDGKNYAPNQAVAVNLTSSDPTKTSVPATVTIPAGESSTYFYVTGVDFTSSTPVAIDATANGYNAPATKLAVNVIAPVFNYSELDTNRSPASSRDNFRVQVTVPGSFYYNDQTPVADLPISLSIVNPDPANIIDGFYSAQTGGTAITQVLLHKDNTYSDYAYIGVPAAAGNYKVQANVAGVATATSGVVTVAPPELKFSKSSVTVGKGLKTYIYEVNVYRAANGAAFNGTDALTVNLTSSDPAKASVPATVTIPAGQASTNFYVTGVDFTNGTPVAIDATANGYNAPATKLAVNVIAPVFNYSELDTNRSPASSRDNFRVYVTVPGVTYPGNQTAVADLPINLSIVNPDPANIVDGFYSAQTGGTAITQVLLHKDNTYSDYAYIGVPAAAGSYKVQADAAGVSTVTSGLVTVTAPELKFSKSSVTAGKGLKTYIYEVNVYRAANGAAFNGTDALTVNLTSSDPTKASVPATVTIPAGQASTYFYVTGVDFTNGTPVAIDATANGYNATATKLAVNVIAPVFNYSGLDTNRSPASSRDNFSMYVTVPGAANPGSQTAAADLPISLSIVNPDPANIVDGFYSAQTGGTAITQVLLHKDNTYSDYAYVGTPTAAGSYKVQADAAGVSTATSGLVTVTAPELKFSKSSVTVGKGLKTYYAEVYVYRAANGAAFNGTDALTVNLICNSTAVCNVPASVTIPAGSSSAYVQVEGVSLGNTTITASAVGYSSSQDLNVSVVTPQLVFSGLGNTMVGSQKNFSVYTSVPGATYLNNQIAAGPITVNLTSSNPDVATVPSTTTIQTGNVGSDSAKLTGMAAGTTTITASGAGLDSATSGVITINP